MSPFPMPQFKSNKDSLRDFDPNKEKQPRIPEWATFSPRRRPEWKIHTRRGDAKNAFNWARIGDDYGIILYHWEYGMWVEKCRQEGDPPEICDECGCSVMEARPGTLVNRGQYIWDPRAEFKRLFTCYACRRLLK